MKRNFKNLLGWAIYILVLTGLVFGAPRALAYALKTDYPMASITSGSMWPVLKKGDLVFIQGVHSKDDIEVDDVIVYRNPQGFTIHRVMKLNENNLITKGDANNISDAPIKYEDVVGKAVIFNNKILRIPALGNISIFLKDL
jgi:signal peptidase